MGQFNRKITGVTCGIYQTVHLLEMKVNDAKDRKFYVDKNKLWPGKEWRPYTLSSLGSKSIVVVRQADDTLAFYKICKIGQL